MAGLLFCPAEIQPHTSVYSTLCIIHAIYTDQTPRPFTGLYSSVSVDFTHSKAHNVANTQTARTPPAPRWRAYRQALHLHRYQIPPTHWTLYRSAQPPIIIRYIRVQHTANHASPAGSAPTVCGSLASAAPGAPAEGSVPPPVPGQPGGAEPLAATAAALFGLSPDS